MSPPKRILVAPLNWGLGHATRCIPIIQELQKQGAEVILASDGRALQLLQKEFPHLPSFSLPAYNIRYPFSSMILSIGWQIPKIIGAIWREHQAIQQLIQQEKIDVVISDNRFGCFSNSAKTVFLTHQLTIKMPFAWLEKPVRWGNFFWIRKFNELWIPDFAGEENLSGELSHSSALARSPLSPKRGLFTKKDLTEEEKAKESSTLISKSQKISWSNSSSGVGSERAQFIAPLSRMKQYDTPLKYKAIFILSGPEPQRTFLEERILAQLGRLTGTFLVVQGKTEKKTESQFNEQTKVISFLTSKELNQAILESEIVVSRSGYSTLMDLFYLQKKAILIPTPGQTEQEYLAERFKQEGVFYFQHQQELDLEVAFQKSVHYKGFTTNYSENKFLQKAITELLTT